MKTSISFFLLASFLTIFAITMNTQFNQSVSTTTTSIQMEEGHDIFRNAEVEKANETSTNDKDQTRALEVETTDEKVNTTSFTTTTNKKWSSSEINTLDVHSRSDWDEID